MAIDVCPGVLKTLEVALRLGLLLAGSHYRGDDIELVGAAICQKALQLSLAAGDDDALLNEGGHAFQLALRGHDARLDVFHLLFKVADLGIQQRQEFIERFRLAFEFVPARLQQKCLLGVDLSAQALVPNRRIGARDLRGSVSFGLQPSYSCFRPDHVLGKHSHRIGGSFLVGILRQ